MVWWEAYDDVGTSSAVMGVRLVAMLNAEVGTVEWVLRWRGGGWTAAHVVVAHSEIVCHCSKASRATSATAWRQRKDTHACGSIRTGFVVC